MDDMEWCIRILNPQHTMDEDPDDVHRALDMIRYIGGDVAINTLISFLESDVGDFKPELGIGRRSKAEQILSQFCDKHSYEKLMQILKRTSEPLQARISIANVFATPRHEIAVETLIEILNHEEIHPYDGSMQLRISAFRSLAKIGNRRSIMAIVKFIKSQERLDETGDSISNGIQSNEYHQSFEISNCYDCGNQNIVLRSNFTGVCDICGLAVDNLPHRRYFWRNEGQEGDSKVSKRAVLSNITNPLAIETLIEVFNDEELPERFRILVSKSLAYFGGKSAIPVLIEWLDSGVSFAAIPLAKLGSERSLPPLLELLSENARQINVIIALGLLGDTRAIQPLIDAITPINVPERAHDLHARFVGDWICAALSFIGGQEANEALQYIESTGLVKPRFPKGMRERFEDFESPYFGQLAGQWLD
jgi:HEAT repeat protein